MERILAKAAAKRERRGEFGDARVTIDALTRAEADALDGLTWPGRPPKPFLAGEPRTLSLTKLETALQAVDLRPGELYPEVLGRPLRDLPRERGDRRAARDAFWSAVLAHPAVAGHLPLETWFEEARTSGRLTARDRELVGEALRVVEWLHRSARERGIRPGTPVDRAILAAHLFDGRPHRLDTGTPLERLARVLVSAALTLSPRTPMRRVWAAAGVEIDPTSTTVLTLGLLPRGDTPIEATLRALAGCHVVLTLGHLESYRASWDHSEVFVCENPSILRAAERSLGSACPPLVCGAGWPTEAVRTLLGQLSEDGATIRYHGDFDAEGVAIFRHFERHVGAEPWRFDASSYYAALGEGAGRDLSLEEALSVRRRAVPEELLVEPLLEDLRTS